MSPQPWNFRQRFSVRVSTILLIYLLVLVGLDFSIPFLPSALASWGEVVLWAAGLTAPAALLFAAIFACAFLVGSLWHRTPQVQYATELLLALAGLMLLPGY